MVPRRWMIVCVGVLLAATELSPIWMQARAGHVDDAQSASQTAADDNSVPADLRSLLASPASELRLITQRYTIDRSTLNGNYDGGRGPGRGGRGAGGGAEGRGGRGMEPAATTVVPLSLSPNRIARLKRFDMSWQAALAKLDAGKLSTAAQADLETLKSTIQSNLTALDADAVKIAQVMPLVPFAPAIIKLNETRIRLEDVNSQQAAGVLTDLKKEIARVKARVEAGLSGATTGDALTVSKDLASRGADSVDWAAQQRHDVVQLLQHVRSALHVVDGHAVQAGRCRPAGLRGVSSRQGRSSRRHRRAEYVCCRAHSRGAAHQTQRGARPAGAGRAAAGRNARRRRTIYRRERRARRARRHEQPWRRSSASSIISTG